MKLTQLPLRAARLAYKRIERAYWPKGAIHFLHIGKAAGTQLKHVAAQVNSRTSARIVGHNHDVRLHDLPDDARYFFSIRHPISRFVSGFYSRKRQGRPRYFDPWSKHEERAYAEFEHANDLAEALFAEGDLGCMAITAIQSVRHTAQEQIEWFVLSGQIFTIRPPIWIVRQEQFVEDLRELLQRAGIDLEPELGDAHANDYRDVPEISAKARDNLLRWYARDLAFYAACERWMARNR